MSISQQIPDDIKRVSRSLGYFLWVGTSNDLHGVSVILRKRLTPKQRGALAFAALQSLDHDLAVQTADAALSDGIGAPIAPLLNHLDEAAFWADMAEPEALEAYCLASFNAMPSPRKAAFLEFVQGSQVA